MPSPAEISEAINNSVGYYLWTQFTIEMIRAAFIFGLPLTVAGLLIWALRKTDDKSR